jgi:hypothetical protein
MKTGILAAVLCIGTINLLAQPNSGSANDKGKSGGNPQATSTPPHNGIAAKDTECTDTSPPKWYAPLQRPDWWLLLVAATTGLVIWIQAREMRRATEAMERSTKATEDSLRLQEAQLEQWIDTTDQWEVDGGYIANRTVSSTTLTVSLGIVNPTKMLLTLRSVAISIADEQVASRNPESVLSPEGTPYMLQFEKTIAGNDLENFRFNRLMFHVKVSVEFEDAFGAINTQTIEYNCTLGQPASCQLEETANKKRKAENPN